MYMNVAIDFGIGLIPILGDIGDAIFKANSRNYALLYEHLSKKAHDHPVEVVVPEQRRGWFGGRSNKADGGDNGPQGTER